VTLVGSRPRPSEPEFASRPEAWGKRAALLRPRCRFTLRSLVPRGMIPKRPRVTTAQGTVVAVIVGGVFENRWARSKRVNTQSGFSYCSATRLSESTYEMCHHRPLMRRLFRKTGRWEESHVFCSRRHLSSSLRCGSHVQYGSKSKKAYYVYEDGIHIGTGFCPRFMCVSDDVLC
jgi:hypothetical protein